MRRKNNLKLIELVKPHDVLYNNLSKTYRKQRDYQSNYLWIKIAKEMNQFANMEWNWEEWRYRWRMLRKNYTKKTNHSDGSEIRSVVLNAMEFLRPFVVRKTQGVFENTSPGKEIYLAKRNTALPERKERKILPKTVPAPQITYPKAWITPDWTPWNEPYTVLVTTSTRPVAFYQNQRKREAPVNI